LLYLGCLTCALRAQVNMTLKINELNLTLVKVPRGHTYVTVHKLKSCTRRT
jgi:hypothetical protein